MLRLIIILEEKSVTLILAENLNINVLNVENHLMENVKLVYVMIVIKR